MAREARLYRQKGFRAQQIGEFHEAIANYQHAVLLDPTYATIYNDLNPTHANAYAHLGLLYKYVQNDPEKSSEHLQRYLQLNPNAKDQAEMKALLALLYRAHSAKSSPAFPSAAWGIP